MLTETNRNLRHEVRRNTVGPISANHWTMMARLTPPTDGMVKALRDAALGRQSVTNGGNVTVITRAPTERSRR